MSADIPTNPTESITGLALVRRKFRSGLIRLRLLPTMMVHGAQRVHARLTTPRPFIEDTADLRRQIAELAKAVDRIAAAPRVNVSPKSNRIVMLAGPGQEVSLKGQALALIRGGYDVVVLWNSGVKSSAIETGWGPSVVFEALSAIKTRRRSASLPVLYSEEMVATIISHTPFAIHVSDVSLSLAALDAARRTGAKLVTAFGAGERPQVPAKEERKKKADQPHPHTSHADRELAILALHRADAVIAKDEAEARALQTLAGIETAPSAPGEGEWLADLYGRLRTHTSHPTARKRVLHAPCNIGNQPWVLSRAERTLGIRSDLIINYSNRFAYSADRILSLPGDRSPDTLAGRSIAAAAAAHDYDVLHYYFGRSLAQWDDAPDLVIEPFADLKAAHALGKPVVMTLQGCDVRLAGPSNARNQHTPCAAGKCSFFELCISKLDAERKLFMEAVLPLCDQVFFLNPELGHYVQRGRFMPYSSVDIWSLSPAVRTPARQMKIVHAPSDPKIKGTDLILAALDALKQRHDFELVLVQDMTHEQAMKVYAEADIAIDQVLAGWYGGVAVELMAMGVPVMCYLREEDFVHLPEGFARDLPILNVHPDRLEQDIEAVFKRRAEWLELSRASRAFVEKWHDPQRIAAWMKGIYADPKRPALPFSPDAK